MRRFLAVLGLLALAAAIGAVAAKQPVVALAPFGLLALGLLAFRAPVVHLMLLLILTAVGGYALQHRFGSHLLPSDAILLTGYLRASVVLVRQRLDPRRLAALVLMLAFAVATVLQVLYGLHAGHGSSETGAEARELLGFSAMLIAMPILYEPQGRERLGRGLVIVGLLLGLWGLATWVLGISFGENVDVGLRTSAGFATSGRGQLHGGLYGYPVAVIMATTMLLAGQARGMWRWGLIAVLVTNLACLALTYERTFWLMTVVTLGFVAVKSGRGRRLRAGVAILGTGLALLGVLATVAPTTLTKVEARVLTLGQTSSDNSVRYRLVETGLVLQKVRAKPWFGSGLGDTLYWGRPWQQVLPSATWFSHNGYLWVIWKVGILVAALLFALLAWAVLSPARAERDPATRALRVAAQGGLLVLLLSSVTFPSFNSLSITAVMGVLLAICFMPRMPPRREFAETDAASDRSHLALAPW